MRSNMTMFASAATANVSTIPAMPGSVSVIGISLTRANSSTRVDQQRGRGHQPEHAVEDEEEEDREREARRAGEQALVERLLAERRRDLRVRDQLEVDRQRADAQALREVVRLAGSSPMFSICAPVRPSMPSGFET